MAALAVRFRDLRLDGLDALGEARWLDDGTDSARRLELTWPAWTLTGECAVEARPEPAIRLDSGGGLMEVPWDRRLEGGGDGGEPGMDPQKEEWLDHAREHRTRLSGTPNGQALVELYGQHSKVLEQTFRENEALKPLWVAEGATREMSAHTDTSLRAGDVVNPTDKLFVNGANFNVNAVTQQLNVAAACVLTDPGFDFEQGPPPGSPYWEAAKAAMGFGMAVETTGNTKQQTNPMTGDAVYDSIHAHDGGLPEVSDEQMGDVMAVGAGLGGADSSGDLGWTFIDEDDRARLRTLVQGEMQRRAAGAIGAAQSLFSGACRAELPGMRAQVTVHTPMGRAIGPGDLEVEFDIAPYALDIDDAHWTGEVAGVARRRLVAMYFLHNLFHEAVMGQALAVVKATAADVLGRRGGTVPATAG